MRTLVALFLLTCSLLPSVLVAKQKSSKPSKSAKPAASASKSAGRQTIASRVTGKAPRTAQSGKSYRRGSKSAARSFAAVKGKRGKALAQAGRRGRTQPAGDNMPRSTPRQAVPSSDRIREIQSALAARGFYNGAPTGIMDADTVSALQRFEASQNLKSDGRIDSLVLIALGLGPKSAARADAPVLPPPPQP